VKKLILSALFILSGSLLSIFWQSCSDPCGVDGPIIYEASEFKIQKAKIVDVETLGVFEDEYYKYAINTNNEVIDFDSIALLLNYEVKNIARVTFFSFAAYACSPAIYFPRLAEWHITTNKEYAGKAAGSNLNEFFIWHPNLQKNGITLSNLFDNEIELSSQQLLVTLNTPPENENNFDFTFQLTFDNKESIEVTVEDVKIKP